MDPNLSLEPATPKPDPAMQSWNATLKRSFANNPDALRYLTIIIMTVIAAVALVVSAWVAGPWAVAGTGALEVLVSKFVSRHLGQGDDTGPSG